MNAFKKILSEAKHIVVLSGAGISAESGVPTFRGAGGYWRTYKVTGQDFPFQFFSLGTTLLYYTILYYTILEHALCM